MSTNSSHKPSIASELFSLKWRKHAEMFCCMQAHRMKGQFCDLQLVCESMRFPAHRLVLASCSDYFAQMLQETPGDSTVVVLNNASAKAVSRLLDFMYQGEVNVPQSELQSLLSTAECLQIKGLMQSDKAPSHRSPSPLPEAAGSPVHKRAKVRAISRSSPPLSPPPLHHPSSRSASPAPTPLTNNTSSINNNNNDDTKHFQSWLHSRSSSSPDVSTNNTNIILNHHHLQQQQKHNLLQLRQHHLSQQQHHQQQQQQQHPYPSSVLSSIRNYSENRSGCHPSNLSTTVATTAALTSLITSLTSSSGGGGGGCRYESALAAAGVAAAPLKRRRSCSPVSVEEIAPLKTENEDDDDEMLMDDGGYDDDEEETSGGDAEHTLVIDDGGWEPSDQSGPGGGGDYALGDRGERARSPTASLLGRPRGGCATSSPPLMSRPPISCATLKSLLPSPAPHRSHYTHTPTSQQRPMAVPFPAGLFGRQHDVFPLQAVANVVPGVRPPWGRPPMKQLSLLGSSMGPLPDNKGPNPSGGKNSGCVCSNCGTNNTKLWRRNQKGDIVCNACGLYFKLHNVDRPSHLFRDNPMTRRRNPRQPLKRDSGVGGSDDPGHESGGLASITPPGSSAPPPNSLGVGSPPSPSAASDPDSRDELLRLNAAHTLESMSQNFSAKAALVLHQQQHNFQQHLLQQQQQQLIHLHQQRDLQQQMSGGPPPKREIEELSGIEDLYDDAATGPRGSEVVAMESSSSPRPPPPLLRLHHSPLAPPPRTSSNPPTSSLTADAGDPLSPASSQHAA